MAPFVGGDIVSPRSASASSSSSWVFVGFFSLGGARREGKQVEGRVKRAAGSTPHAEEAAERRGGKEVKERTEERILIGAG